jgi:hypothetical protein
MSAGGIVTGFVCVLAAYAFGKIVGRFNGRRERLDDIKTSLNGRLEDLN